MGAPDARAVLVPVKELSQAKSRLAPLLSLEERRELAIRMLAGVLAAVVAGAPGLRRVVVSSYHPAIHMARELDFEIIEESTQQSESASVDAASAQLAASGATGVLRIPLDLPALSGADVAALLAAIAPQDAAVLVPSRAGTGTNAIFRAPPTLFASSFGPGSLQLHRDAAAQAGTTARVLPLEAFALDIDDPDDVAEWLRRGTPAPALDYLRRLDVATRLARMARAPA